MSKETDTRLDSSQSLKVGNSLQNLIVTIPAGVQEVQGNHGSAGGLRGRGLPDVEPQHLQEDGPEPQPVTHHQGQQRKVHPQGQLRQRLELTTPGGT